MEDDAARRAKAHEIYDTFIPDSALTQINIKDKNRKFIDAALGDTSGLLDANIFEVRVVAPPSQRWAQRGLVFFVPQLRAHCSRRCTYASPPRSTRPSTEQGAREEIYFLMNKDNYSRFKSGALFEELMAEVNPYHSIGAAVDAGTQEQQRSDFAHTAGKIFDASDADGAGAPPAPP